MANKESSTTFPSKSFAVNLGKASVLAACSCWLEAGWSVAFDEESDLPHADSEVIIVRTVIIRIVFFNIFILFCPFLIKIKVKVNEIKNFHFQVNRLN